MAAYAVAVVCGALFLGDKAYEELRRRRRSLPAVKSKTDVRKLAAGALAALLLVVGAKALVAGLALGIRTWGPKVAWGPGRG